MIHIEDMDGAVFFDRVRNSNLYNGRLTQGVVDEINSTLDAWEKWAPRSDARFVAYSLGTQYRECGADLTPKREYGRGRGKAYGRPAGAYGQTYYGRGKVQLTWLANYQKADKALHAIKALDAHESLVVTPDIALRDDVSSAIMVRGMLEGWFTGKKLADYFQGDVSHWIDARRIINGTDHAALVASYALAFYAAMRAASGRDKAEDRPNEIP